MTIKEESILKRATQTTYKMTTSAENLLQNIIADVVTAVNQSYPYSYSRLLFFSVVFDDYSQGSFLSSAVSSLHHKDIFQC